MAQINFGISKSELVSILGDPKKESQVSDYLILRYNSNTERYANYYYFEDDILVLQSISKYNDEITTQFYIDEYGTPDDSFLKAYRENAVDSNEIVHVWLDKGIEITVLGDQLSSKVLKERIFNPIQKIKYQESWGKDYSYQNEVSIIDLKINNQEIEIISKTDSKRAVEQSIESSTADLEKTSLTNNVSPIIVITFLVLIVIIIFFIIPVIRMRRKKRPEEVNMDNQ